MGVFNFWKYDQIIIETGSFFQSMIIFNDPSANTKKKAKSAPNSVKLDDFLQYSITLIRNSHQM